MIIFFVRVFKLLPIPLKLFIWDTTSSYSQILFIGLRYILLKSLIQKCGDNVKIGKNVSILNYRSITIGSNVSTQANCYLDGAGGINIGDNVYIAHNSTILSSNHGWEDVNVPIKYNSLELDPVVISSDVWIGCGVRILAGVIIGSRCIVAAGAVVTKSIEHNCIVGGVPENL